MAQKTQPERPSARRNIDVPDADWITWRQNAIKTKVTISDYIVCMVRKALKVRP